MSELAQRVLASLQGKTLATAESCTGGLIGGVLTAVPGSSAVYKGGVISYTNEIKTAFLGVPEELLQKVGAVSAPVAEAMAQGARERLHTDVAVSVTGLAGPGGDDFGNPVGTVFIGYADETGTRSIACHFEGDRESVRCQAAETALFLILRQNNG